MHHFMLHFLAIWSHLLWVSFGSYVQINSHGSIPYCNSNPGEYSLPELSQNDAQHVSYLRQVQVFTRHGSRITSDALTDFFAPSLISKYNMEFDCNISTKTTRLVSGIDSDGQFVSLNKIFKPDEQLVEGNCEAGQSLYPLITQHTMNGKHLFDRYFNYSGSYNYNDINDSSSISSNSDNSKLMNESVLYDIFTNIKKNGYDSRFIVHSTNIERTLASAMTLVSTIFKQLVNESNEDAELSPLTQAEMNDVRNNLGNVILDCVTHDEESDPYIPLANDKVGTDLSDYMLDACVYFLFVFVSSSFCLNVF